MTPESNITEYKRELPTSIEKMEKDVVAFLNSEGGTVYFGIDDNGDILHIPDIDDLQLKLKDRIKNNISQPALDYCKITIEIRDSHYIVVLTIQAGWEKPFYLKKYGMTPKGCFKRAGSASEPMSAGEIEGIFAKRVRNSLKNIPSPRQDLTFRQLNIYYDGKGKVLNDYFLLNLKLLTDDGKLNYAAYLLADENDNSVKFAKYADDTRADLISNEEYGCCCLVKIFERISDRLIAENTTFTKITMKRRLSRKLIDTAALREAVLNALLHNDYANFSYPKIEFFANRVEITSMGGLPYGLSEEAFFSGASNPRNQELMRVFRDLGVVEELGSGVPRILKAYGKEVFQINESFIRVTLPFTKDFEAAILKESPEKVPHSCLNLGINEKKILALISGNPNVTAQELSRDIGISERSVRYILANLKQKNIIHRKGSDRTGSWEILN